MALPSRGDLPEPDNLDQRMTQMRAQALHTHLPSAVFYGAITAVGVYLALHKRLAFSPLLIWLAARLVMSLVYCLHTLWFRRAYRTRLGGRTFIATYRVIALVDGMIWGALGWALTPLMNTEVAAISLGTVVGVAAFSTLLLHVDMPSAFCFAIPTLLPNVGWGLVRNDDLGYFCAFAMIGLLVLLLHQAWRSTLRLRELLHLRLQSEQTVCAQSEALQQAQALVNAKGRFFATMSHEMRTPLHGILGLVRLLRQSAANPQATHQLELIHSSGDHLLNVINDVLDFSRMESGRMSLHELPFKLHALLREVAETSHVTAAEKGLALDTQIDLPPLSDYLGDPVRLRQVLHNLLGNAIKFTPRGQISLSAWRDAQAGHIRIEVRDTGIGIPPPEQTRIFDAFHQVDHSLQRRLGGTGLGLTISRELCRAMGGDLHVTSTVGVGSVFTAILPLNEVQAEDICPMAKTAVQEAEASTPINAPAMNQDQPSRPLVLLVEDNAVNAIVAEAELRNLGADVTVMRNGRDAVNWLEQQQPDLVLMDCEMPELDGIEATRYIRTREQATGRHRVPIIALTANGWDAYAQRCQAAGMDGHLGKPYRTEDLARTLRKHIRPRMP